jgi:hypothetical protein
LDGLENDQAKSSYFIASRQSLTCCLPKDVSISCSGLLPSSATQDIEEGDLVYVEPITISHNLTMEDASNPAGDSCFLVRKIVEFPSNVGRKFEQLGLMPIPGMFAKPKFHNKFYLKGLAAEFHIPCKKVLNIWRVICAYHVSVACQETAVSTIEWTGKGSIRVQLSPLSNRTNHYCNANSGAIRLFRSKVDFEELVAVSMALTRIRVCEEITSTYLQVSNFENYGLKERRQILSKEYGFICKCQICKTESSL